MSFCGQHYSPIYRGLPERDRSHVLSSAIVSNRHHSRGHQVTRPQRPDHQPSLHRPQSQPTPTHKRQTTPSTDTPPFRTLDTMGKVGRQGRFVFYEQCYNTELTSILRDPMGSRTRPNSLFDFISDSAKLMLPPYVSTPAVT